MQRTLYLAALAALLFIFVNACKKEADKPETIRVTGVRDIHFDGSSADDTLNLQIEQLSTPTEEAHLSIEGLPNGFHATFNMSSGKPPFSAKLSVTSTYALKSGGSYPVKLIVNTPSSRNEYPFSLIVGDNTFFLQVPDTLNLSDFAYLYLKVIPVSGPSNELVMVDFTDLPAGLETEWQLQSATPPFQAQARLLEKSVVPEGDYWVRASARSATTTRTMAVKLAVGPWSGYFADGVRHRARIPAGISDISVYDVENVDYRDNLRIYVGDDERALNFWTSKGIDHADSFALGGTSTSSVNLAYRPGGADTNVYKTQAQLAANKLYVTVINGKRLIKLNDVIVTNAKSGKTKTIAIDIQQPF